MPRGRRWLECDSALLEQWDPFPRISWLTCVNLTLVKVLEVYSSSKGIARRPDMSVHPLGQGTGGWDCRQKQKSGSLQPR